MQNTNKKLTKLNFQKQRHKLNNILLSQYLISNGNSITQAALSQIQSVDKHVASHVIVVYKEIWDF